MSQSQKEAVFTAITSVLSDSGIKVEESQNVAPLLTREIRGRVTNILVEGFRSGTVSLDKPFESDSDLRTYCSGLTSNWLRKDTRLNGGMKYIAKNPGSRVGSSDASLTAMRNLLKQQSDPAVRADIQSHIDARVDSIKASRKPAKTVNVADLPAELQYLAE
jgi:hypothetical protein